MWERFLSQVHRNFSLHTNICSIEFEFELKYFTFSFIVTLSLLFLVLSISLPFLTVRLVSNDVKQTTYFKCT